MHTLVSLSIISFFVFYMDIFLNNSYIKQKHSKTKIKSKQKYI